MCVKTALFVPLTARFPPLRLASSHSLTKFLPQKLTPLSTIKAVEFNHQYNLSEKILCTGREEKGSQSQKFPL